MAKKRVGEHVVYVINPDFTVDVYAKETVQGLPLLGTFILHHKPLVEPASDAQTDAWVKLMEEEIRPRADILISLREAVRVAHAWANRGLTYQSTLPADTQGA